MRVSLLAFRRHAGVSSPATQAQGAAATCGAIHLIQGIRPVIGIPAAGAEPLRGGSEFPRHGVAVGTTGQPKAFVAFRRRRC